jgi:hypothetical protein
MHGKTRHRPTLARTLVLTVLTAAFLLLPSLAAASHDGT